MKLFTLLQALDTLQTNAPSLDCEVDGVHNDTRLMKRGDLFVAVPGSEMDGHCYIKNAIAAGASMIVTERPLDPSVPHVVVPDARAALAKLAACMHGYPAEKMILAGVTGTEGKTTVTHIIKGLIEGVTGQKAGLIGTIHMERTTPDAVALNRVFAGMVNGGRTHCVMEVSSHALAQSRVLGLRYAAGAFTNLHHEHMDYHTDMEDYFQAKSRLFSQCERVIINIDDPYGRRLRESYPDAITFAVERPANFKAENIKLHPNKVTFQLSTVNCQLSTEWHTPGLFSVYNALAAMAVGRALGLPSEDMARVLPLLPPVRGRMETVPLPRDDVHVVIDYAHTPEAVAAALKTAKTFTQGRLIALFGCGGDRDKSKRPLMGAAAREHADLCFVTSDNPRSEDQRSIINDILTGMGGHGFVVEPDRREAIRMALDELKSGDTLMLIGKGHETAQEIHGVKHPFDEREVVTEAVK
ncbi:MAG: UDP-N-acetylmuramoyl-L-alanyl-D-glutamate--2,6-diaminopimelate ligase [Oscillospiraceae bacterium]|nr:UDP-N-acetylmuramoyl-L-alanyl-D-glutamate--2,6-diaminopimelate ligase [Oscillospiraceae bacterium]